MEHKNKTILPITILEKPLCKAYNYTYNYFQSFLETTAEDHKLTPLNALRFLQHYSATHELGLSAKDNLKKALVHIIKLTLLKQNALEQEALYRQAMRMFKVKKMVKTVMPMDVPTSKDLNEAKKNSHKRLSLLIDFINTTSLRIGEALSTRIDQCKYSDLSNGYAIRFIRKGGHTYETWIPKELYVNIVVEYDSKIFLFPSPLSKERPIRRGTVQRWLRIASKFTDTPLRPHLLRHKSINDIVRDNKHIPLQVLCKVFGHSEKTLRSYYLNPPEIDVAKINRTQYQNSKKSERNSK
ncbi:MAG: tyrosine-type recombinase/integrase [Leptospiraceae bacterium]|nr:tyrosine-type recombinase/integrase [Leptospiraceae bacterium]